MFIEPLPLGADAAVVDMAFEQLPPLPLEDLDRLPGCDELLDGALAERVLRQRVRRLPGRNPCGLLELADRRA